MNRNFLREAIADAKAVKESAIANAKVALEEAFSPQVKAMFASKIEEMEKDEMDESYDEVDEAKEEAKDTIIDNWSDKDADNAKKDKTRCEGLLKKIETAIADIENKNEDTPTKSGPGSR